MADLITEMQDIMCRSCTECEANWCDGEDKQECCWMKKIAEVGQTIEKEIQNKAIDEFAERMKDICKTHSVGEDKHTNEPIYAHEDGTWHSLIDEIAEQMKGGAE